MMEDQMMFLLGKHVFYFLFFFKSYNNFTIITLTLVFIAVNTMVKRVQFGGLDKVMHMLI